MTAPVAPKTTFAGFSAAVSGAALYLLQTYVFKGAVPAGVESLIYAAVPGVVAFAAAWLAPHQVRPGDAATEEAFRAVLAAAAGRMAPEPAAGPQPPPVA